MVSEPFLWLSDFCGHLRRSSAALAFIQSSLSEASRRRHAHSTYDTRISTFCAFNCQRKVIERQNNQSQAKPNQEGPETESHTPPWAGWSFCLKSTRSMRRHAPSVSATCLTRHHAPVPRSLTRLLRFASCHVSPRWRHTATSSHVIRWPLTLTIVKNFQQDLFCSVFRVDSDFELRFCIWGL